MQESVIRWPLGLDGRDLVGVGVTAVVARLDAVVKHFGPTERPFLEREKLVYERLGRGHSGIVRYFGAVDDALLLQFASHTSVRQYMAGQEERTTPLAVRRRWVEQLFDAVCFVHSKGVLHGDISCNNVFLDDKLDVKLGDFGGSAIDNLAPLIYYETSHYLPPGQDTSPKTELFALGSTVYEMMTGARPYKDLPDHEVTAALSEGRYPDLGPVAAFRDTIMGCWRQTYATVEEALCHVKSESAFHSSVRES
ncbi:uncharacterized protein UV8b_05982 [Ustilaginoidea virens]|uniref:EKC/KEOPS complex subunit BUD32 n=1 Tax=Ustilaginoidea virens TaxID=1159556 RepID=A0A063BRP8_USTVR|nr:uncharacterized protein UV8b_05982 [Ustilaginoidea virens]QUC21739.1 hypothetical protein UV8b_05982 [Ustilaginoidea virens]GAO17465.1 hypothetical protein UVI_02051960 [Ustilaginoidea virens]